MANPADRVPNFCIGAQRAATTYLYELLRARSNAHLSPLKEVHYFDSDIHKSLEFYHSRFPLLDHAVDITPSYSVKRERLARIYMYNPKAKILLLIRDPVDRIVSHYIYYKDRHADTGSFQSFLKNNTDDCIGRCAYDSIAKAAVSLFGSKSFMSIQVNKLTQYPEDSLAQIASFFSLSIINRDPHSTIQRVVNSSGGVRSSYMFRRLRSLYQSLPIAFPYEFKASLIKHIDAVHHRFKSDSYAHNSESIDSMKTTAQDFLASIQIEDYWDKI